MIEGITILREFNIISVIVRIILATILGGAIGMERVYHGRAAGLRTHMLVCLGSAMTVMVGLYTVEYLGYTQSDPLRVAAQVISGIGFLGVGMILVKGRFEIIGLTTAAGLWATAAMGIAIGAGFYEGALICTVVILFSTAALNRYEQKMLDHRNHKYSIYVELDGVEAITDILCTLRNAYETSQLDITAPRSSVQGNVGMEISLLIPSGTTIYLVLDKINQLEHVVFTLESV